MYQKMSHIPFKQQKPTQLFDFDRSRGKLSYARDFIPSLPQNEVEYVSYSIFGEVEGSDSKKRAIIIAASTSLSPRSLALSRRFS